MSKNWSVFFSKTVIFLFFVSIFSACANKPKQNAEKDKILLTYKVIKTDSGWGYDILLDHKLYVHQEFIPDIQGYHPFKTLEDAEKTAKLVANKIKQGIQPPTITKKEIDSMRVKYNLKDTTYKGK